MKHTYLFRIVKEDFYEVKATSKKKAEEILESCDDLIDYWRDDLTEPQPSIEFVEQVE